MANTQYANLNAPQLGRAYATVQRALLTAPTGSHAHRLLTMRAQRLAQLAAACAARAGLPW